MALDTGDELRLFEIAKAVRVAHDAHQPLYVTPEEYTLLRQYCDQGSNGLWWKSLREAFKDALPHRSPLPWDDPLSTHFGSLEVIVRKPQ